MGQQTAEHYREYGSLSASRPSFVAGAWTVLRVWAQRRDLVAAMARRDVLVKYKGSMLGFLWSLVTPLVLLAIYTAVFGLVFRASWPGGQGGMGEFAVMVFCGFIPFNFYNEALSRSTQVIAASPNYVKRIAFPTEVLPLAMTLSGFLHALINTAVLVAGVALLMGRLQPSLICLPLVWLPVLVSAAAFGLIVSAMGVFLRDLGHVIGLAFSALLFASPILYPASRVPENLRFIIFIKHKHNSQFASKRPGK